MKRSLKNTLALLVLVSASVAPVATYSMEPAQAAVSIWSSVQDNAFSTASNLSKATTNAICAVASYAPYVLNQITKETNIISGALKDTPITTTALLALIGYGVYQGWNWINKNRAEFVTYINEQGQVVRSWVRQGVQAPK